MGRARTIDWDAITGEAVSLLSEYLRLNTVNPPGNERLACEWLGGILDREGIPYRLYARDPDRPTLVATLPGDGSRGRGLVLLNHTDVVPAEAGHWSQPPLSGLVQDGYIWGRGAMDMKSMGILELMTLLIHHRGQIPLRRDLTFFAVADEEAGGAYGIDFLSDAHPELFDCDFVLNEGGTGSAEVFGVRRPVFHVGVAEKGPLWLRLRTTGTPGHGSVPHDDNALERLVRALGRLASWERPLLPSPEVLDYFEGLRAGGILADAPTTEALAALAAHHPRVRSMQTNSLTATMISAGVRPNVIPAEAEATIDCRLVSGYDPQRFIEELRAVIDDPRVIIETIFEASTPASPTGTELYAAIERAVAGCSEDAIVVPSVSTGFTDSRVFRRRGIPAYGFIPILLEPEDAGRAHGNDERVSIDALRLGLRVLHATVREVCG
jgi:acetylornithine deacetylase/succinyl-diaminopimelate desuccinylase-like protein